MKQGVNLKLDVNYINFQALKIQNFKFTPCKKSFMIINAYLYRFSRTANVTDIGQDFDLNDDYYLVYGMRTMGKL